MLNYEIHFLNINFLDKFSHSKISHRKPSDKLNCQKSQTARENNMFKDSVVINQTQSARKAHPNEDNNGFF